MLNNYNIVSLSYNKYLYFYRHRRKLCRYEEIILGLKRMIYERKSSDLIFGKLKIFFKIFTKIDINLINVFILIENKINQFLIKVTNRLLVKSGELGKWH